LLGRVGKGVTRAEANVKLRELAAAAGKSFGTSNGCPSNGWWDNLFLKYTQARSCVGRTIDRDHAKGANPQMVNLFFNEVERIREV
jgi:hypothetical protein